MATFINVANRNLAMTDLSTLSAQNEQAFGTDDIYSDLVPPHGSPTLKPLVLTGDELPTPYKLPKIYPKSRYLAVSVATLSCWVLADLRPLTALWGKPIMKA